jgi:hypothetical protein
MQCCDKHISAAAKQHTTIQNAAFFHVTDPGFTRNTEISSQGGLIEFSAGKRPRRFIVGEDLIMYLGDRVFSSDPDE